MGGVRAVASLRSAAAAAPLPLLLLLALVPCVVGKYSSGTFHLDAGDFEHGPEYEIAKFSFLPGKATISGKVRYKTKDSNWMTSPALYLFNDDAWGAPTANFPAQLVRAGSLTLTCLCCRRCRRVPLRASVRRQGRARTQSDPDRQGGQHSADEHGAANRCPAGRACAFAPSAD